MLKARFGVEVEVDLEVGVGTCSCWRLSFSVSLRFIRFRIVMHIVAIAWIYVVLMMSITERSVIAGIMTFLLYGVFPLAVILYLMGAPQRRRRRSEAEKSAPDASPPGPDQPSGTQIESGK
jgi:hypothetical protein